MCQHLNIILEQLITLLKLINGSVVGLENLIAISLREKKNPFQNNTTSCSR